MVHYFAGYTQCQYNGSDNVGMSMLTDKQIGQGARALAADAALPAAKPQEAGASRRRPSPLVRCRRERGMTWGISRLLFAAGVCSPEWPPIPRSDAVINDYWRKRRIPHPFRCQSRHRADRQRAHEGQGRNIST